MFNNSAAPLRYNIMHNKWAPDAGPDSLDVGRWDGELIVIEEWRSRVPSSLRAGIARGRGLLSGSFSKTVHGHVAKGRRFPQEATGVGKMPPPKVDFCAVAGRQMGRARRCIRLETPNGGDAHIEYLRYRASNGSKIPRRGHILSHRHLLRPIYIR